MSDKLYAEVTLREIVENYDVTGLPFLTEVKQMYSENAKLRKLIGVYHEYCLCNQYSKKSAHQLITEIEDMTRELGIEVQP